MKRVCLIIVLCLFTTAVSAETLRNSDIIKMVKAGLSTSTIKEKIRTSDADFKTDTDSLIILKDANVPDSLIDAMIAKQGKATTPSRPSTERPPVSRRPSRDIPEREFDVYLETSNWNTCPGTLTIDEEGLHGSGCAKRNLNFDAKWSEIKSFCYEFAFFETMYIETEKRTYRVSSNDGKGVHRIQELLRKYRDNIPEKKECD